MAIDELLTLGRLSAEAHHKRIKKHKKVQVERYKHDTLVLVGSTKRNRFNKERSQLVVAYDLYVKPATSRHTVQTIDSQPTPSVIAPHPIVASVPIDPSTLPLLPNQDEEGFEALDNHIKHGLCKAQQVIGKDTVVVVGNTGVGKSTFLNYMLGCELQVQPPIPGLTVESSIVVAPESRLAEVMKIGHGQHSETYELGIYHGHNHITYCDCPGFFDTRGATVSIANAVSIKNVLQHARSVRLVILLSYTELKQRSEGLTRLVSMCTQLLGDSTQLVQHKLNWCLGLTHVPVDRDITLENLKLFLKHHDSAVMQAFAERLFLYDPLDRGREDFWDLATCRNKIHALQPLSTTARLFHTVLGYKEECRLREFVEAQREILTTHLNDRDYAKAWACYASLHRLRVIENATVDRILQQSEGWITEYSEQLVLSLRVLCGRPYLIEAKEELTKIELFCEKFMTLATKLDLPEVAALRAYYNEACSRAQTQAHLQQEYKRLSKSHEEIQQKYQEDQALQMEIFLNLIYSIAHI